MIFDILTLFPSMFHKPLGDSIIGRAQNRGLVTIRCHQIRDFTENRQKQVDDYPYGGGQGCVMQAQPLHDCWKAVRDRGEGEDTHTIYLSPAGKVFGQADARRLARGYGHLILVCGHYEGVDQRFIDACADEEISIGDFVMTGGEIPAMALTDAVCRLLPGVLSDEACFTDESHWSGLLEYPQYSRPEIWNGRAVPEVLRSGNHGDIAKWRRKQALLRTLTRRPELFRKRIFTKADLKLLDALKRENTDRSVQAILNRIHTGRITVRKTTERDFSGLSKLRPDLREQEGGLDTWLRRIREAGNPLHYSIYAEDHGFCGEIVCDVVPNDHTAKLEITLLPHARGEGIAAFGLADVIKRCFEETGVQTLSACAPPSSRAEALFLRLGFQERDLGGAFLTLTMEKKDWC